MAYIDSIWYIWILIISIFYGDCNLNLIDLIFKLFFETFKPNEQSRKVVLADCTCYLIQPKPEPPNSNVIYSCTFNPEGTLLFVAISDILVVYNAENG